MEFSFPWKAVTSIFLTAGSERWVFWPNTTFAPKAAFTLKACFCMHASACVNAQARAPKLCNKPKYPLCLRRSSFSILMRAEYRQVLLLFTLWFCYVLLSAVVNTHKLQLCPGAHMSSGTPCMQSHSNGAYVFWHTLCAMEILIWLNQSSWNVFPVLRTQKGRTHLRFSSKYD